MKQASTPKAFAPARTTYESMIIVGPSGFGKTSLADELQTRYVADARARGAKGNVWICDPAHNWPQHPGRFWPGMSGIDDALIKHKTSGPGLLIFDDADLYYRHPTDARLELIVANRHWQKDVMMVARRPQGIHKDVFQNADTIAIFNMRQAYAREYINREMEDETISRQIPTERFRYLLIHRPSDTKAVFSTQQRTTVTASDIR